MKKLVKRALKEKQGFTLIELVVVIAILGILAAIIVPSLSSYVTTAKTNTSMANARTVYTAVELAMATGEWDAPAGTYSTGTTSTIPTAVAKYVGSIGSGDSYSILVTTAGVVDSVTYTTNSTSATYNPA